MSIYINGMFWMHCMEKDVPDVLVRIRDQFGLVTYQEFGAEIFLITKL